MNCHRASLVFAGLTCAAFGFGCKGSTNSSTVPTKNVAAFIEVNEDGFGSIEVDVDLQVRSPNDNSYLRLVNGDSLSATMGKQGSDLIESASGHYYTSFPLSNVADVAVGFNRSKFDDAPKSTGVMPEVVTVDGFEGAVISRDLDTIILELPPTAGFKFVDIAGSCITTRSYDIGQAPDVLVINPGDLYSTYVDDECDVTLTLSNESSGVVDGALHKDSTFFLRRSRSTTFYSIP